MDLDAILADVGVSSHIPPQTRDLQALTRAWVNEKGAPELLGWPETLMERVMERIRRQIEVIEDQAADPDPKTSFRLIIIQTELERFKFMVRSLLRTRLEKIDRHALYYLQTARDLLSPTEIDYATAHQALLSGHYSAAFLGQFPSSLQRLDDTAGGIAMVEHPDTDRVVFVRALVHDDAESVHVPGTDIAFGLRKGSIYVVRWSAVREKVESGDAELI